MISSFLSKLNFSQILTIIFLNKFEKKLLIPIFSDFTFNSQVVIRSCFPTQDKREVRGYLPVLVLFIILHI